MSVNNNDSTNSRNEKRFTLAYEKENWWAVRDGAITLWKEEVITELNKLHEENQVLKRHIKANTLKKIKVEDIFNCAKYDKFYDNKEAIKSIDWIAKELGIDLE